MTEKIQMVDLQGQYLRLKPEIDNAMQEVITHSSFINGPQVKQFIEELGAYLNIPYVIPCGNGTDALQIALTALNLHPGDEVIVPAFTYVAAVEVIALLGLTPVLVDVDDRTFNINTSQIEEAVSERTKAIIVVHLFGQSCDMDPVMKLASKYGLYVVEDNAQSIGADSVFPDESVKKAGTIGHIGTTSFFPSKPLACYGDGGAMMTADPELAERLRMIANHGQKQKYQHQIIGCNSRLDTLQAAVLSVKLKYISAFNKKRQDVAERYDKALLEKEGIICPLKSNCSTHVYHQYTIQVAEKERASFQHYLKEKGIPTMIYYPLPIHEQEAFKSLVCIPGSVDAATRLSRSVVSLPIHTEMTTEQQDYIIETIRNYE